MKKCDVVMKGGITSGIVYPGAVCELANEYQFVNIGGTSAGAIAAALTAAAEYRRQSGSSGGFDAVGELPRWLSESHHGLPRLLQLFQPAEATAPLHRIALSVLETQGRWQRARAVVAELLRSSQLAGAAAAIGALLLAVLMAAVVTLLPVHGLTAIAMAIASLLVAALAAVAVLVTATWDIARLALREIPRNRFGICSGQTAPGALMPALTDWLSAEIDRVAGRASDESPLTFGDLWTVGGGDWKNRTINLEMMTTNLTHGRPYRLPGRSRRFFFAPSDMRELFPDRVVNVMVAKSRTTTHPPERPFHTEAGEALLAMPRPEDLPVVVATRMSLSFPLLLSAVPLYTVDYGRQDRVRAPELCWFSDGGITSNFPVHFFDAPLPRWPTFAFNLAEWTPRYHKSGQRTYVPRTNSGGILEWWNDVAGLPAFAWSIVTTMQNWRDNMLLRMPGHRDRIAHVLLMPKEGGLNLTMASGTIRDIGMRGGEAAKGLRERFGENPPPDVTLTWRNHKWVRFRSFMHALEGAMGSAAGAFDDATEPPSFRELLDGPQPSYAVRPNALDAMRTRATAFVEHVRTDFGGAPFRSPRQRPKPPAVLRAMPRE